MTSPKGLVVDFGGVLTTSIFESFAAFCREHGIDPVRLRAVLRASAEMVEEGTKEPHLTHMIETGKITSEEFDQLLASKLSEDLEDPLEPTDLKSRMFAQIRPEPSMISAVKKIRGAGYPTGLLSNSWGEHGYPRDVFEEIFDVVVISGEVGLRKPDPEIFFMTSRMMGVDPSSCVFVDDLEHNVRGAEAVGMIGIHHTDPSQTLALLEELFGLPLADLKVS